MEFLRICDRANRIAKTPFLTLEEQEILTSMTQNYQVEMHGGFENSERKRALIIPVDSYEEVDFGISVISAKCDNNFYKLTHSDVLGAIMNIGIEREVVGDIVFKDSYIYIAVSDSIVQFVMSQLTRIGKVFVNFEIAKKIPERSLNIEEFEIVCTSRRLDTLVAHFAKCNREEAKNKITDKQVKVNGLIVDKHDKIIQDNSMISIRKHGRFIVYNEVGKTKKDNIVFSCGKYS